MPTCFSEGKCDGCTEPMNLVPTGGYLSPCYLAFPASYPLMSLFWYFFNTGPGSTDFFFFSQAVCLNHLHHKNNCHTSFLHTPIFIESTQHIIMADRLPLAELSIQNKIRPPAETTQPIKTKKVHPSNLPKLCHPCSLNVLSSLANKWSAMTHPLRATVMGFKDMIILYAHYYLYQDLVLLSHTYTTSTTATTV